ncbi:MAG: general secretion pathway protein GspB [Silvania sp.]|uniref:general secretion pathway protein GspB n=1 Tax=Silvania sp. TaxID=3016633 RepID=UPI003EE5ACE1
MSLSLSLPLRPRSRLSARMLLALSGGSALVMATMAGAAVCYGWHSLHNAPIVKKVDVPHSTQQPWRNLRPQLSFSVQPLPVEEEESIAVDEPEAAPGVPDDAYPDPQQLPDEVRRRMPGVKYEAHIYSSEPGKSVINLNGNDYAEGAAIGGGISLVTIEPDSAIFSFEGQTFRVTALSDW